MATLLLLAAGVFWIGKKQFLFQSTYRLQAEFPMEVRVGGIHEGTVRQIQLPMHPNNKVRVLMDLAVPTRNVIKCIGWLKSARTCSVFIANRVLHRR